jgi:hypothetical protein
MFSASGTERSVRLSPISKENCPRGDPTVYRTSTRVDLTFLTGSLSSSTGRNGDDSAIPFPTGSQVGSNDRLKIVFFSFGIDIRQRASGRINNCAVSQTIYPRKLRGSNESNKKNNRNRPDGHQSTK